MSTFSTLKLPFTSVYTVHLEGSRHHHEQFTLREWGVRSHGPHLCRSGFSREVEQRMCLCVVGGEWVEEREKGEGRETLKELRLASLGPGGQASRLHSGKSFQT